MPKAKNFDLGEEATDLLADFCEAHYGAPAVRVLREAVRCFVRERLEAEPEVRKRFEIARQKRTGQNVRSLRAQR